MYPILYDFHITSIICSLLGVFLPSYVCVKETKSGYDGKHENLCCVKIHEDTL